MENSSDCLTDWLPDGIFRAYDIRGVMGKTLSPEIATRIGQAFATHVAAVTGNPSPVIATARDGRTSSPLLSAALITGLTDAGAQVKDCGLGPTPLCYFAAEHLNADGAIMLTGSHNPPDHNGFKMVCAGLPVYGDEITAIKDRILSGDFTTGRNSNRESVDLHNIYISRLLEGFEGDASGLKAVWDPGNGAAGDICEMLMDKLPGKHWAINTEIDGTFPNHHPDPTLPENLTQLTAEVKRRGADIGFAFDGDGDRIGAVDSQGNILWADQMLTLMARDVLAKTPGQTIIADVKASQTFFDDVAGHGGVPLMWKTGHSLIKAKMKETGAPLGGEMSGHIFFADRYYGFDDGLYAAIRLLEMLAKSDQSLTALQASLPAVQNTPELRVECPEGEKFGIIDRIRTLASAATHEGQRLEVNATDGIRAKFKDGWWLVRASNTQEALSIRCEAQTPETLDALKAMTTAYLKAEGVEVNF